MATIKQNKENTLHQEALFAGLVKTAIDPIITIDEKGIVETFNAAAEKLFQYKAKEVIGHNVKMLMPSPHAKKHDGYLRNYLKTGKRKIIGVGREVEAKRKDGAIVPIHLSLSEAMVGKKRIFVGIARDISKLRAQEDKLRENQFRLQSMIDTAVDGVITIDAQGKIQTFNPAAEKLFGYQEKDVVGKNIKLLMPHAFKIKHDQYLKNYLSTGKKKIIGSGREVVGQRKDGQCFPVHLSISEFKVGGERFFTGVVRDISELKQVLEQLQGSEERSRAILDTAVDAIITIDEHAKIQTANPSALTLFGYTLNDLKDKNINILMPSPYHEQHDGYVKNYLKTGHKKIIGMGREVEALNKAGTIFPIHLSLSEFQIRDKRFFAGIIRDISKFKKAEKELQETNEMLESQAWLQAGMLKLHEVTREEKALDEHSQAIITFVSEYIGASVGALYLCEEQQLRWQAGFAFTHTKNKQVMIQYGEGLVGQAALDKKTCYIQEITSTDLKVSSSFVKMTPKEIIVLPILFNNETIAVIEVGTLHHFTKTHRDFLDSVVESLAILLNAAQVRDKVQRLLEETQAQAEELEVQQEELRVTNESLEQKTQALQEQQVEMEETNEALEEQRTLLEEQKEQLMQSNQGLELAKKILDEKAKALEISSQYKSEFLANMSHELRTPLNSIIILAQLLAENTKEHLNEKEVDSAQTIYASGKDLLNLINDILDLSKVEAGQMEVMQKTVVLKEEVEAIEKQFMPMMNKKKLKFSMVISKNCPKTIETDQMRFEQIIKNLISNALKYTEKGSVRVNFQKATEPLPKALRHLPLDKMIMVCVKDTGIGIPKDKQRFVFDAFKQLDSSLSKRYAGTGLGLSVSKGLASLIGGEITLVSQEGKGSVFTFYLPEKVDLALKDVSSENVSVERDARQVIHFEAEKDSVDAKINSPYIDDDRENIEPHDHVILMIEDDLKFAAILREQCHKLGFKCIHASDGESGLQMMSQVMPSGILLDIRLPGMNGFSVLKKLKSNAKFRHIPVHVLSVEECSQKVLSMGAIGYLQKPVESKALHQALEQLEIKICNKARKILLVEDNEIERKAIIQFLERKHIDVVPVNSVALVLKKIKKEHFDCIILDLMLKGETGFDLLQQLHESQDVSYPPIIVYTGKDLSIIEQKKLEEYASTVIIKGSESPERLLDETLLFLNKVEQKLPCQKQRTVKKIRHRDDVLVGKKVLVVDDDMRNIFSLKAFLEDRGCNILVATTGKEALDQLQKELNIDVVLMDIMMPEMDGFEATRRIRKQKAFVDLPIIALTAKAMKGDREKCLHAGATDYLTKPIDVHKLLSLLRIWLST